MAVNLGTVGEVNTRVTADTTDYNRKLTGAVKATKKFGSNIASLTKVAAKYAAAIAAAAAVLGGVFVRRTLAAIDASAKLARQFRGTIEGLETAKQAASLAGIEFQKLQVGLRTLDVSIGEAIKGTGEYAEVWQQLGLNVREVAELDVDERIMAINAALRENVPAAERAALAARLFGTRVGSALLTVSEGQFRDAARDVRDFGAAVSAVDAATIEQVNDNLGRLKMAFQGVLNQLTIALAPILLQISEDILKMIRGMGDFGTTAQVAVRNTIMFMGKLLDLFHDLRIGINLSLLGLQQMSIWAVRAVRPVTNLLRESAQAVEDAAGTGRTGPNEAYTVGYDTDKMVEDLERAKQLTDTLIDDLLSQPMPSRNLLRWFDDAIKAANEFGEAATRSAGTAPAVIGTAPADDGRLRALTDGLSTAKELEENFHKQQMAEISEFFGDVAGLEDEFRKWEARETERHLKALIAINDEMMSEYQAKRKEMFDNTEAIRVANLTAEELERERFDKEMEQIREARDARIELGMSYDELEERAEKAHMDRMKQIRIDAMTDIEKFNAMSLGRQAATVIQEMVNMTQGVARESRAMFEINKMAATANAVVSAYEGISRTLGAYPYPISVGLAALQGAAAFAQVAAIQRQTFQGGGRGAAPSTVGSTPAPPVSPVGGGASAGGGADNVTLVHLHGSEGSSVSMKETRQTMKQIERATQSGGRVVVVEGRR